MSKPVKMVALDLDGTALDPFGRITEREELAFKRAMDMGVHIVVATGRAFHSLPDNVFSIGGIEYAVTSNGAQVTRLKDRTLIYENCIAAASVTEIADILEKAGVRAEAFTDGRAYIDVSEFNAIKSGEIRTRDSIYVLSTRNPVDDIFAFMREHRDRIENISINYPSNEAKEKFSGNVRIGIPLNGRISHLCTAGTEKLDIKYDGTILPCPAFKEINAKTMTKYGIRFHSIYEDLEKVVVPGGKRKEPLCKKVYGFHGNLTTYGER